MAQNEKFIWIPDLNMAPLKNYILEWMGKQSHQINGP